MAYKAATIALHPVVGLVLQVRDAEKFPQALGFEGLIFFSGSRVSVSQPVEEDGGDKRLAELEIACEV